MNNTVTESIPQPTDRNDEPRHDGYRHLPGPERFEPGSENDRRFQAEDRQLQQNTENRPKPAPEQELVTESLEEDRNRDSVSSSGCPRAWRHYVDDAEATLALDMPCRSRTCEWCKEDADRRDLLRIKHSLELVGPNVYIAHVPLSSWPRLRQRAHRAGACAVKMPTPRGHDLIVVASSEPITDNAHRGDLVELAQLVEKRPPGGPPEKGHRAGRTMTSGVGLITVTEWETIEQGRDLADLEPAEIPEEDKVDPRKWITIEAASELKGVTVGTVHRWIRTGRVAAVRTLEGKRVNRSDVLTNIRDANFLPGITIEDVAAGAAILGISYTTEGPHGLRLNARWDDERMTGLRAALTKGPKDNWSEMRAEAEYEQGVLLEEPPMAVYVAELEGVAV